MTESFEPARTGPSEYRIFGPPGTGKTTFLTRQIETAAARFGAERVLVTSFTKAAATELAGRELPIPEDNVGTLHSHCFRTLGSPEIAETRIKEWNLDRPEYALSESRLTLDEGAPPANYGPGDEAFAQMQNLRARMIAPDNWPVSVQGFAAKWQEWKDGNGLVDFTDMLEFALRDQRIAPGNPSVLIADEAQDFSLLQLTLIRQWARHTEYMLVAGDEDQLLYGWCGCTPDAFLKPKVAADHKRVLHQSYRIPRAVHAVATRWVETLTEREPKEYLPRDEDGEVRRLARGTWNFPDPILADAEKYLANGKSVMFLASCSYMLDAIKAILRREGVPFHNPYRKARTDWNPLAGDSKSTLSRMLAFLRLRDDVWGQQAGEWVADDLQRWLAIVRATSLLAPGAKATIASLNPKTPITVEMIARLFEPEAGDEMVSLLCEGTLEESVAWLQGRLLVARKKAAEYPAAVLTKRGGHAIFETPQVMLGTIHCSPPDEEILTKRGLVPIGELAIHDLLVGYSRGCNRVVGGTDHANSGGYAFQRSQRNYTGNLIVLETGESRTRVTPNHRVLASFDPDTFPERWAVYLMRRKNWWRIGICTTAHRPYRSGGLSGRLATEQADAGWLLGIYETRRDALIAEATLQAQYGIPGLTFETASHRALSDIDLANIHEGAVRTVWRRAQSLLKYFGLEAAWPLYVRNGRTNVRGLFLTEAANLVPLSGHILMATTRGSVSKPTLLRVLASTQTYSGPVFGIDVPPYHHYISGGAVDFHNSVKGGQADAVYVFPDLSQAGMAQWGVSQGEARDGIIRQMYVGMTRARESLILCRPASACRVPLEGMWH